MAAAEPSASSSSASAAAPPVSALPQASFGLVVGAVGTPQPLPQPPHQSRDGGPSTPASGGAAVFAAPAGHPPTPVSTGPLLFGPSTAHLQPASWSQGPGLPRPYPPSTPEMGRQIGYPPLLQAAAPSPLSAQHLQSPAAAVRALGIEASPATRLVFSAPSPAPAETHPPLPQRLLFPSAGQGLRTSVSSAPPNAEASQLQMPPTESSGSYHVAPLATPPVGAEAPAPSAAPKEALAGADASAAAAEAAGIVVKPVRRVVRKKPGEAAAAPRAKSTASGKDKDKRGSAAADGQTAASRRKAKAAKSPEALSQPPADAGPASPGAEQEAAQQSSSLIGKPARATVDVPSWSSPRAALGEQDGLQAGGKVSPVEAPAPIDSREPGTPLGQPVEIAIGTDINAADASPPEEPKASDEELLAGRVKAPREPCCTRKNLSISFKDAPMCCIHCPVLFAVIVLSLVTSMMVVLFPGIDIDTNLDTLLEADGASQDSLKALSDALQFRGDGGRRLAGDGWGRERRLTSSFDIDPSIIHKIFRLRLLYRAKKPGGMLTYKALNEARQLEVMLRKLSGWQAICLGTTTHLTDVACDPGISLANSVWPVEVAQPSTTTSDPPGPPTTPTKTYALTGNGTEPLPLDAAVSLVRQQGLWDMVFPLGWEPGQELPVLRTVYEFNMNCCTISDSMADRRAGLEARSATYKAFVAEELYPTLLEFSKSDNEEIEVYWEGNTLDTHETMLTLLSDAMFAIGSFVFILFYLTMHTHSFFLSCGVLFLTAFSIPAAYVSSAVIGGTTRVTGACFLSLFLIVGFGVDDVLVFVTFWNPVRSRLRQDDWSGRIKYMWKEAGMACLATSMTTAASFFANLASVLRPLREFGFFMGMCIMWVYILLSCCLPALLVMQERCCEACWRRLGRCLPCRVVGKLYSSQREKLATSMKEKGVELPQELSSFADRVLMYTECVLVPCRWPCAIFWVVLPVVLGLWTAQVAAIDGGMPQMFPEGQNGREVVSLAEQFTAQDQIWPRRKVEVCSMGSSAASVRSGCSLTWCPISDPEEVVGETPLEGNASLPSRCACRPTSRTCYPPTEQSLTSVTVESRFVGLESVEEEFWSSDEWRQHVGGLVSGRSVLDVQVVGGWYAMSSLVQEDWESGLIEVSPHTLVRSTVRLSTGSDQLCTAQEVCYCGTHECTLWDEGQQPDNLGSETTVLVPEGDSSAHAWDGTRDWENANRRLSQLQAPLASAADPRPPSYGALWLQPAPGRRLSTLSGVSVVWGIEVHPRTALLGNVPEDLWEYDPNFRPQGPSVQRFLLEVCDSLESNPQLQVQVSGCWMRGFKTWLKGSEKLEFPLRASQFNYYVNKYTNSGYILDTGANAIDSFWFNEDSALIATFMEFLVPFSFSNSASADLVVYKESWDAQIAQLNSRAPIGTGEMWGVSRLWIRAEAEQAIIDSTLNTMIVSSSCAFAGALFFTHFNLVLSLMVFLAVSCVTVCLAWVMAVLLNWSFGVVEVLGLIIFVGYSITYSIHIAAKYSEMTSEKELAEADSSTLRREAVTRTLHSMGSSILGSAATTLGASFFLFYCQLQIFVKLATVLFTVTFFAVLYALAGLPAVLLCIGPNGCCGLGTCIRFGRRISKLLGAKPSGEHRRLSETDSRRFGEGPGPQESTEELAAHRGMSVPSEAVWRQPEQAAASVGGSRPASLSRPPSGSHPSSPMPAQAGAAAASTPRGSAAGAQPARPPARGPVML